MLKQISKLHFAILVIILLFLHIYAVESLFTSKVPGANDFYPRWKGSALFWLQDLNPYSDEATQLIQRGIYGRLAFSDEDQVLFVYPFYTTFLLFPFARLPYSWTQAAWFTIIQFSLILSVILCLRLASWHMPLWLLSITLIWSVTLR